MEILESTVTDHATTESTVELLISDGDDTEEAAEYVAVKMRVNHEADPLFYQLQAKALEHAQTLLTDQIRLIAQKQDRSRSMS